MKKMTRRELLKRFPSTALGAAALTGALGTLPGYSSYASEPLRKRPNILLLMVDQQHIPPKYPDNEYGNVGAAPGLKEILGFRELSPGNPYAQYFPGLLRLRKNAVVLRTHYTASSACVPSRTCIMTGSYKTGVDQTDGLFKSAQDVPWLDPNGTPTIGDWFRAIGYSTHYFGKWHVSYPNRSLEPWGFSDWNTSSPEPHGGGADNLGVYRDVGFADDVVKFLSKKGKNPSNKPWFTVGSLVNPHDNGNWPSSWQLPNDEGVVPWVPGGPDFTIPYQNQQSLPGFDGRIVNLNPDGFPQDNCTQLPTTYGESLVDKPACQMDYSLKLGLVFKSYYEIYGVPSPHPFQLDNDAKAWSLGYNEFYYYCQYLSDLQLRRILKALDNNGLAENTIVVFLADHGDMAGAHGGMIQKWHNAYEEAIRVPMVISSPLVNESKDQMKEILQPTSSIDVLPTLLALAGFDESGLKGFVGADLSSHIKGESGGDILGPDGKPRTGVFYMTNDMITEIGAHPTVDVQHQYNTFLVNVDDTISKGYRLEPGTVTQPNNVRALCTGDWKIAKYEDPNKAKSDEWELYYLKEDAVEQKNLVNFKTGEVRDDLSFPVFGLTKDELVLKNKQLQEELARQEALMMG